MKTAVLWGLAALNVALVVAVVNRYVSPVYAQAARPSDYLMVPGQVTGITTGVVFIVDTNKGELSGMTYNDSTNTLEPMPKIDLVRVFKEGQGVVNGGGAANKVKPR
jgi:hypothetical protein